MFRTVWQKRFMRSCWPQRRGGISERAGLDRVGFRSTGRAARHPSTLFPFTDDLSRRLILSESLERGMTKSPIGCPLPKVDMRNQDRLNESRASARIRRQGYK